jgi:uncharacterized membrane protein
MVEWTEIKAGLRETRRYLLSHHEPSEWYRCYAPTVFGRRLHVCARCAGIYPGIAAALAAYAVGPAWVVHIAFVALFPAPALVDWLLTALTERRGYNPVRTATGALLGYGYGLGLALFFLGGDLRVPIIGVFYGALAGALLAVERAR